MVQIKKIFYYFLSNVLKLKKFTNIVQQKPYDFQVCVERRLWYHTFKKLRFWLQNVFDL